MLKLDKECFLLDRDLIFVAAYLSPEGATVFNTFEKVGLEHIEKKINQIVEEYENIDIMLAGILNVMSGELDDFIMTDSTEFVPEFCDNLSCDTDDFNKPRENVDKEINNYARALIRFRQYYGMHIVNERVTGDQRGNIACVANGKRSVLDYILVNTNGLLTGCEGHTEKYRTSVFVQPELARAVLKDQGPVFLSMARANPVNKPFII